MIKPPEAKQHRADLAGVSQPLAQGSRSGVDVLDFWGGKAPGGQKGCSQGALQGEFLLGTHGRVREEREDRQRLAEMTNRFHMGRVPSGAFAGLLPVGYGVRRQPRLGVVLGEQLRLSFRDLGKVFGQHLGNALVVLLARTFQERLIGCILDEGMLENVPTAWRQTALVDKLSVY
jgi:hypothetical protein